MIRSMTGYGRGTFELAGTAFDVEVRAVNHRFLDVRVRLPRALSALEPVVRDCVAGRFARGQVEISVQAPPGAAAGARVEIDLEAVGRYLQAAHEIERRFGIPGELEADDLLALPGVSRVVEAGVDPTESGALRAGVETALAAAVAMREAEGQGLDREFRERLARVADLVGSLEGRSGSVQETVRERLRKRARELEAETGLLDEARLHQEVVLAADRLDVSEELSRLRSHVGQFLAVLDGAAPDGPVGRRLEFLLQELGREANTIGSKANDAEMAHAVVELKTELERIREQVQNVE
jgi:uncharacterized protein (TIGR00255 family)